MGQVLISWWKLDQITELATVANIAGVDNAWLLSNPCTLMSGSCNHSHPSVWVGGLDISCTDCSVSVEDRDAVCALQHAMSEPLAGPVSGAIVATLSTNPANNKLVVYSSKKFNITSVDGHASLAAGIYC